MTYKYLNMRTGDTTERDVRCPRRDRMRHWVLVEAPASDRKEIARVQRRFGSEFTTLTGDVSPDVESTPGIAARTAEAADAADASAADLIATAASSAVRDALDAARAAASPEPPKGNASRDEWAEYAVTQQVVVSDEMSRNDIRDLFG